MSDFRLTYQPDLLIPFLNASERDEAAAGESCGPPYLGGAAPVARGGLSGWQRKKVADFIEAHLGEKLPLLLLAGLANLSPFHFARAFKVSFGLPPHRYHAARRIARAKALLAQPEPSITEIARALGFAETSSFSTAFRKGAGMAPSEYRKRVG